jgi:hypothetical protein
VAGEPDVVEDDEASAAVGEVDRRTQSLRIPRRLEILDVADRIARLLVDADRRRLRRIQARVVAVAVDDMKAIDERELAAEHVGRVRCGTASEQQQQCEQPQAALHANGHAQGRVAERAQDSQATSEEAIHGSEAELGGRTEAHSARDAVTGGRQAARSAPFL